MGFNSAFKGLSYKILYFVHRSFHGPSRIILYTSSASGLTGITLTQRAKKDPYFVLLQATLTLILLTCRIWWAPNNANRWQMGFNSA